MGRILIIVGVFFIILGLLFTYWQRIPLLGRLPGDFVIRRGSASIYFPLISSILVSVVLTIVVNLVLRLLHNIEGR